MKVQQKIKRDNARVKLKLKTNGVIEVATWDVDSTNDRLDKQPEEVSESKLMDINETNGCEKKDDDMPEGMLVQKKSHIKRTHRIFHNVERTKDKKLKPNPNLGSRITIC